MESPFSDDEILAFMEERFEENPYYMVESTSDAAELMLQDAQGFPVCPVLVYSLEAKRNQLQKLMKEEIALEAVFETQASVENLIQGVFGVLMRIPCSRCAPFYEG